MTLVSPVQLTVDGDRTLDNDFDLRVRELAGEPLTGLTIDTVQVNIGLRCNLACHHCHVESSPARHEQITWQTMQLVLQAAQRAGAQTLDLTGGAPEMHPHFRRFVTAAANQDLICRGIRLTSLDDHAALERGAMVYEALYAQLKSETPKA